MSYGDDRAAIMELLVRYWHACDRKAFDEIAGCFTQDAQAEYSGVRLPRGVDNIVEHLSPLGTRVAASQHISGSISVSVDGDAATARSYAVAYLVLVAGDGHELVQRGLVYDDQLVRTPDGWRIRDRVHQAIWSVSSPTGWPVPRFTGRVGPPGGVTS
jgi:hypothetical protein